VGKTNSRPRAVKRLRVLAGPNGSGKSTIKRELKPQWIGVFINADEIERDLKINAGRLSLRSLGITGPADEVLERIKATLSNSGLDSKLDLSSLLDGISVDDALSIWLPGPYNSYLAAALAEAVRQELLEEGQTFTFETVMSHPSKIEFMKEARDRGYRVYLYFVATDDPGINIARVRARVEQGGHPVEDTKVVERYHKSIALMTSACEAADRAYIYDNSGASHKLLAEVTDFDTIKLTSSRINPWLGGTDLLRIFTVPNA